MYRIANRHCGYLPCTFDKLIFILRVNEFIVRIERCPGAQGLHTYLRVRHKFVFVSQNNILRGRGKLLEDDLSIVNVAKIASKSGALILSRLDFIELNESERAEQKHAFLVNNQRQENSTRSFMFHLLSTILPVFFCTSVPSLHSLTSSS